MFYFCIVLLAIISFRPVAVKAQCVDCSKVWNAPCHINETGYQCQPGAKVHLDGDPFVGNIWSDCQPKPYKIEFVGNYCCSYSSEYGCMVALHPDYYKMNASSYCEKCRIQCGCMDDAFRLKPSLLGGLWISLFLLTGIVVGSA